MQVRGKTAPRVSLTFVIDICNVSNTLSNHRNSRWFWSDRLPLAESILSVASVSLHKDPKSRYFSLPITVKFLEGIGFFITFHDVSDPSKSY